ncbi:MAG: Bax inhibitor-1 family protein [Capsulimonas sp.]|uniref:Bax inhibitor-1/YccA family protein n=1 Tax=Capsulimonas sp. TaxID=2494211 RepID=UPI0032645C88
MNNNPYYSVPRSAVGETTLIQRVCYLLATCLLVTAGAAWWAATAQLSPGLILPLFIGSIACVIGITFTRRQPVVSLILLYVLSVLEGLMAGPVLSRIAHGFTMGPMIIAESAALSALLVVGLGSYVWISNKDFGGLGKMLYWALLGLFVVGLIGMFINMGGGGTLLYSLAGTVIFCGYVLYDVSNIKHRFGPEDYVMATVQLYLDFINLFWFILQILLSVSGGGSRSRD